MQHSEDIVQPDQIASKEKKEEIPLADFSILLRIWQYIHRLDNEIS